MPRDGVGQIAEERAHQIDIGWSEEHDDAHDRGELAYAAALLAMPPWERAKYVVRDLWPWDDTDPADMPQEGKFSERTTPASVTVRIRELEKAGALCAAEIDRLVRLDDGG